MHFDLTPEQQAFQESVRSFARAKLAPNALNRAHQREFPWGELKMMADVGLLGLTLPESVGGQGAGLMEAVLAIQAVAESCPRSADLVQAGNFGAIRTFAEYAPEALRNKHLPAILAGEKIMSVAMSEPDAGSAVTELRTSATERGEHYVLNGTKIFSTNSPEADAFLVYVRFDEGVSGIGSILVERDTPGLTVGSPSEFMNGESWCPLYFDDCEVPAENLILGHGGFKKQISGFNVERLGNASRSIAVGRFAFELAKEYVATRAQFGRPLMEFQGLQWGFADMHLMLESAQLLLMRAVERAEGGIPGADDTALAKLAANQAGFEVANKALQMMGGTGFSKESLAEYCFRRTRGWQIAGGSTEILKNRIAEGIFDRRFDQRPPRPQQGN
ncbi:MAG: acyl-CoA dehydrogenase family protein [Cryobacterium sp.]|nr:acyl-CoA dehydrogenase family protein [Cryobacterium sp.]